MYTAAPLFAPQIMPALCHGLRPIFDKPGIRSGNVRLDNYILELELIWRSCKERQQYLNLDKYTGTNFRFTKEQYKLTVNEIVKLALWVMKYSREEKYVPVSQK